MRRYLLSHLLSESAHATPEAVAVGYGDQIVVYRELEERSNRLARVLRAEGVQAGDRVGLHLKKTAEAIVGLFGILKAGACVVPVALGTPSPRFRDIADQCAMRGVVASAGACEQLGGDVFAGSSLEFVVLTDGAGGSTVDGLGVRAVALPDAAAAQSSEPLPIATIDRDLAYVLFTSGSTGSPKGVMLSHQAVLTFVDWASDEFGVRAEDRLSNHAPLNFDLSTFDIYAAIGAGASVTVIPEGLTMFPTRLADLIERVGITVWYSVPSVLTLLVTRGGLAGRELSALRTVLFAGEVFPVKFLGDVMRAIPAARYFNLYGPTETNVCTFAEVVRPPEPDGPPIPIGRACSNTKTLVLDENGDPLTLEGEEGLLHVGGSGVMSGYFGRPDETQAAFVPDPLAEGRDERLYCTGDWVSIGRGGEYHFLGRRDHMVKVGGYRIELGDVETALYAHPAVREAVAVTVPDDLLGSRIRAFVVTVDPGLDESGVKRHCASLLPSYMVPQEVRFLEALPRTATDKVDRHRLA